VIGTGFDVPIQKANVIVRTDPAADFTNTSCFIGFEGSNTKCAVVSSSLAVMQVSASNLQAYQGISLNAHLPDGYMATYLEPNKKPPPTMAEVWAAVAGFAIPILIVGGIAVGLLIGGLRYMKAKRRRAAQTVVAQYDPPGTLTPAEVGHLSDDSASTAEVTATVIDLARRGFIKIQELPAPSGFAKFFGKRQDYILSKLKEPAKFTPAEAAIFGGLFGSKPEVQLTKLDRAATSKAGTKIQAFNQTITERQGLLQRERRPLNQGRFN
jgi:hypothetical protein